MPNMAAITVKKNDGTTDVVYTNVAASSGDKTPAVWRNNTVGTAAAHRPELTVSSQSNGPRTARRLLIKGVYPTLVTGTDGKVSVADRFIFEATAVVPQGMPDTDVNEGVSQMCNLMASALMKDQIKSGYAAT